MRRMGDEMKTILYLAVVIALGVARTGVAASPEEIARSWKERGFVALSRLDSLKDKQDRKSRYQSLLEFAFAMHATAGQSNPYGFVRKTDNGLDFYKIILNKTKTSASKTGLMKRGSSQLTISMITKQVTLWVSKLSCCQKDGIFMQPLGYLILFCLMSATQTY